MLRLATLLILTSLLVIGWNRPPSSAQKWLQEHVQQTALAEGAACSPANAEFPSAQDTKQAVTPEPLLLEKESENVQTSTQETFPSLQIPEEGRRKLVHELGHAFIIFRELVQAELKLTDEQKGKLSQLLRELLPDAMQFFQQLDGLRHEEEEKARADYLPKALAKLEPALKEILTESQRSRLRQMERQREGLFGGGETLDVLHIMEEQRKQFMAVIQQAQQQKMQPLLEELEKEERLHPAGVNPAEFQHKMLKMRRDLEASLEALLTEAQKKQWKEMLGKPVDQSILFELSYQ
jgi:hypothetical protein